MDFSYSYSPDSGITLPKLSVESNLMGRLNYFSSLLHHIRPRELVLLGNVWCQELKGQVLVPQAAAQVSCPHCRSWSGQADPRCSSLPHKGDLALMPLKPAQLQFTQNKGMVMPSILTEMPLLPLGIAVLSAAMN